MAKNILVIVESPLQLINANEYIREFATDAKIDFYLISSREVNNLDQMNETFKLLKLKGDIVRITVQDINKSKLTRLNFYKKVIGVAWKKDNKQYDLVLVGHITSIYQLILANTIDSQVKTIYLDDGTSSFYEQRVLQNQRIKSFSPWYKRIFPALLGLSANIKYYKGGLYFYTMYRELITKEFPHLMYSLNNFNYLKRKYSQKDRDKDVVFFIGTPFYWKSARLNNSKELFRQIAEYYIDKKVIYFPHRYEGREHKDFVMECGWEINETGLPIELSLINSDSLPKEFAMFTSSAFYTIIKLIPFIKFKSFELNNLSDTLNSENTYKLYREYDKIKEIEVIKLS
ncbi:hypothetical protein J8L85_03155 [Maribacter sp. MMG018]|uniref:hypothetical protein n=1 Tax=Maribacter sp. MMG018 TaxID=2822688 RepID=UPI001B35995C|nr:hypothetical protein [Maribacter sp. MMG018]MBQ4913419.1 hypothetical protein [Maribacter sp. MMG018]